MKNRKNHLETEGVRTSFVRLGRRIPGVLYEPETSSGKERINVLVMHSDEDYLTFPTGAELAARGYTVLCANIMNKEGIIFSQNEKMYCVKEAIEFLKAHNQGKVVLMGHSGGGTLMSAYQAVAENGPEIFQGKEKLYPYRQEGDLPKADGIMLLDSNWGNAVMQLFSLDPAILEENDGRKLDPKLDLFRAENGFDPKGSVFSDEFIQAYQKAQGERNNRIVDAALERLACLEEGSGHYSDDEPFIIPGAAQTFFCNKLFPQDIRLMAHTQGEYPLLHKDGTITTEAPTLVMGMTAGWEFLASETIYQMSAAEDKTIAFVEGATHKFTPARHCEEYPGQFGDTMKILHDYVDQWLSAGRF